MTRISSSVRRPPAAAKPKTDATTFTGTSPKATVAGLRRLAKALQSLSPMQVSTSRTPQLAKQLLERLETPQFDVVTISPKAAVAALKQLALALKSIEQSGLLSTRAPGKASQAAARFTEGR